MTNSRRSSKTKASDSATSKTMAAKSLTTNRSNDKILRRMLEATQEFDGSRNTATASTATATANDASQNAAMTKQEKRKLAKLQAKKNHQKQQAATHRAAASQPQSALSSVTEDRLQQYISSIVSRDYQFQKEQPMNLSSVSSSSSMTRTKTSKSLPKPAIAAPGRSSAAYSQVRRVPTFDKQRNAREKRAKTLAHMAKQLSKLKQKQTLFSTS